MEKNPQIYIINKNCTKNIIQVQLISLLSGKKYQQNEAKSIKYNMYINWKGNLFGGGGQV